MFPRLRASSNSSSLLHDLLLYQKKQRERKQSATMPSSRRAQNNPALRLRPPPLKIAKEPCKAKKPIAAAPAVVVHMHSPKIIHAKPQDFMRVVQLLTGNSSSSSTPGSIHPMLDLNEAWETQAGSRLNPTDAVREFRFC